METEYTILLTYDTIYVGGIGKSFWFNEMRYSKEIIDWINYPTPREVNEAVIMWFTNRAQDLKYGFHDFTYDKTLGFYLIFSDGKKALEFQLKYL